jgi:glycosyltransferase involved in cell wall biosynthesis
MECHIPRLSNMRPLKIIHILEATVGGTRTHLRHLLTRLDPQRFSVSLVYSNRRDPHFKDDLNLYDSRGIALHEVPMQREIAPWQDLTSFLKIWRIIRRGKYDLVHAHSSKAGFLGRLAAKLSGVPAIIYSPHGFAFQYRPQSNSGKIYRNLEKFAGHFHHRLLCVSQGERDLALQYRICSGLKIAEPIFNSIPLAEMKPRRSPSELKQILCIPEDSLVVGMVAHFRPQKGYLHFIRAIPEILRNYPNAKFVIVGDGPLLPAVKNQLHSMGITDSVVLAGHQECTADYYQLMNVFVLSSLWEGMPYVILEAMAMGLPVVATNIAGNNELVEHGANGFLTAMGDSHEIAERIIELLSDEKLRESFGRQSRLKMTNMPTIEDWAEQYQEFYASLWRSHQKSDSLDQSYRELKAN